MEHVLRMICSQNALWLKTIFVSPAVLYFDVYHCGCFLVCRSLKLIVWGSGDDCVFVNTLRSQYLSDLVAHLPLVRVSLVVGLYTQTRWEHVAFTGMLRLA